MVDIELAKPRKYIFEKMLQCPENELMKSILAKYDLYNKINIFDIKDIESYHIIKLNCFINLSFTLNHDLRCSL